MGKIYYLCVVVNTTITLQFLVENVVFTMVSSCFDWIANSGQLLKLK